MNDLDFKIGAQEEAINTLKAEVKALRDDIAEIKQMVAMSRGGLRMLIGVGSVAATLGAAIAEVFHWLHR